MRPGIEAPTFLPGRQLVPEALGDSEPGEIVTSAVRGGRAIPGSSSYHSFSVPPPAAPLHGAANPYNEARSDSKKQLAPRPRTESSSDALPRAQVVERRETKSKSSKSEKKSDRKSKKAEKSVAQAAAPAPQAAAPIAAVAPGVNAIDPLAVPVPPELGPSIYSWVRRLALQADLPGADRVLRDALLDLSSSLAVTIVYPGQDGLFSLVNDEEIPRDTQPLIAVATARRAIVSSHSAIIPVLTSSECVAVITMTRNPRNPAYHPVEQIAMIALARESAAILHHLAVTHIQKQAEINADKGGLYRGEALEAHRARGTEGVPVHLTPVWVKRTYPVLLVTIICAVLFATMIKVPTYSSGFGVVSYDGKRVNSSFQGAVAEVVVKPGQEVHKGQVVLKLNTAKEDAEYKLALTEYNAAKTQYLGDRNDEGNKRAVVAAAGKLEHAKNQLETRVIRAPKDGVVSDTRIKQGDNLNPGDQILTIVDKTTEPEIIAFLPGGDRPRLRVGMELQVDLSPSGYKKKRETAIITEIGTEAIGGAEAAKYVGATLADSMQGLKNGGPFVIVKARLSSATFKTDKQELRYTHGMQAQTEVRIQEKPFLVTLLPALEKYLPE
jgi:multidrug resistance efflux pump